MNFFFSYSLSGANVGVGVHSGCLSQRYEDVLTWPSRPVTAANNDDTASYQHVHVCKRCRCVALQSVSASLNDPLMSTVAIHASIGSQRRHVVALDSC